VFTSNLIRSFFLVMLLGSASAWAERVSIIKDAPLRLEPRFDAKVIATVKQGTIGVVSEKQGPWLRVDIDGKWGWVLTVQITYVSDGKSQQPRQFVAGTATIGITNCFPESRFGFLSEVNGKQLALLDSFAVSKEDAAPPDESLPAISTKL
jgi:hypothetical protein